MSNKRLTLIAGWGYTSSAMSLLADELATNNCCITSTNELWSKGGNTSTHKNYSAGLISLIKELGDCSIVVGWSMGGIIALETACSSPGLISALVLISSTAKFCTDSTYDAGIPAQMVRAMDISIKKDFTKTLTQFIQGKNLPASGMSQMLIEQIKQISKLNREELPYGLKYLEHTDCRHCLRQINIPVLLIHGKADTTIPPQASEFLHNHLPDNILHLYEKCDHLLPFQKPRALAADIRSFLKQRKI